MTTKGNRQRQMGNARLAERPAIMNLSGWRSDGGDSQWAEQWTIKQLFPKANGAQC